MFLFSIFTSSHHHITSHALHLRRKKYIPRTNKNYTLFSTSHQFSFHQKHKKNCLRLFFQKAFFSLFFSGCYFLSTLFPTISTCITASLYYPDSGSILSTFPFLASSLKHTYYFPLPLFLPPSHFPSQPFPGSIREPSTHQNKKQVITWSLA